MMKRMFLLLALAVSGAVHVCYAWGELITNEQTPYTYQDANWRAGNFIQSLFYHYADLPALSENFIGRGVIPSDREPDLYYIGNTGIDLLDYCEEAEFTPVVRLELIKKLYKSMYKSHYDDAEATWLVYSGSKRQVSFLTPCLGRGPNYNPVATYPNSRLLARNLPDTAPEKLALVWPRVLVDGKWQDDSTATYHDLQDNKPDAREESFTTIRKYAWPSASECTITGTGWGGQQDKVLEITVAAPSAKDRQALQLVFSNFTDPGMGFSAPYPTKIPETIQLPDGKEISSKEFSVSNPDFNYIIIYTKDADKTGFEYQNAMLFGWDKRPSKLMVHWEPGGQSSSHKAYAGTEGVTDTKEEWHSGGYCRVEVEYAGPDAVSSKLYLERFQGVDPSASLSHLHKIARNVLASGKVGKPGYLATESGWMEEPVSGLAAGAYILSKYDQEEDRFGGDYAAEAIAIATKLMDDRIAMWERGRKSSSYHEFITGAYYLSRLYGMPGKFNDPAKQKYYRDWTCRWTDKMVSEPLSGSGRRMMSIWRAYELSHQKSYKQFYEKERGRLEISADTGLTVAGKWQEPWDFYSYGDIMGALGRRGTPEDARDIQTLITYLEQQKRWTDTGYMGIWWEVTVENHNFFGRWCKGLQMSDAPKHIVSVSEFPAYYKKDGKVVVEMTTVPPIYNPSYWDQDVMANYLPVLPHKIAKSILFRIDNILLKKDYPNNWWMGTEVPSVMRDLNLIRSNIETILKHIDSGTAMTSNRPDVQRLLAECEPLFRSASKAIDPPKTGYPSPAGSPISLGGELSTCQSNFGQLKAVLNGWKPPVPAKEIGVVLDAKQVKNGVELRIKDGESENRPSERNGRACWESVKQANPGVAMMYWLITDPAFKAEHAPKATLTVDYFDEGTGTCQIMYDSSDSRVLVSKADPGAWKEAGKIKYTDSKAWKTYTCTVEDACFSGRCHGGDIRFNIANGDVRPAFAGLAIAGVSSWIDRSKSAVRLDPIFTDDMVLQRDEKVRIYGSGSIESDTVTVSFGGQTRTATVQNGLWEVWLDPMKANATGQTLTIKSKEMLALKNILVGDVWVLGGQSNMMTGFKHFPTLAPMIKTANQPLIRVSYVDFPAVSPQKSGEPQEVRETPVMRYAKWYPCVYSGAGMEARSMLDEYSPPGYFFATNLIAHTQVPVGLVMACLGGTKAQWWTPMSTLEKYPELDSYVDEQDPNTSYLYNSVIHPIRRFTIRGVLWYQGEGDNPLPEEYGLLFPRTIQSWREAWGKTMPFIFASLSSFAWPTDSWAYLRESQAKGLSQPDTGMIMTYDAGDYANIHPEDKLTVGYRFYMKAREVAYGEKIIASGPVFDHLTLDGAKAVVHFKNTGGGLVTCDVSMPKNKERTEFYTLSADKLEGFTVCGADGVFHPAEAVISGKNTVVVQSANVKEPVAVRYGWATFVLANLYNRDGFPAEVFRTDTFPVPQFTPKPAVGETITANNPAWGEKMIIAKKSPETSVSPVTRAWRNGWKLDAGNFAMMYFAAPSEMFAHGGTPKVKLTVVYFDEGRGRLLLRYDSSDSSVRMERADPGVWKEAGKLKLTNTKTWKTCTFEIDDAQFDKRCNGHDFRIEGLGKGAVIGDVYVSAIK